MMKYLAAVIFLLLIGCGYHFPGKGGSLPGKVKTVYIPLFVNKTKEPQLESLVSNEISVVFGRNSNISQVESLDQAEAVLEGVVSSYASKPIAYDTSDDISEYRATMTIDAVLRQVSDGRLLWQGNVSWKEEYLADDDKAIQEDFEREAIDEISLRISEELLSRMLDDF
ncbi:LPS assembly lipoprotein LptE [Malonomonas rubra]|uniref:LPS assembly lipoprotein LptE n=1 Tax=Malonomonas rubra TaxID=57040 RepID=UPI0026EAB10C|nr:LPS assembly lipoprotein LptE [Malonomonas rubra]